MSYIKKTSQWVGDTQRQSFHKYKAEVEKQLNDNIQSQKEQESDCIFVEDDNVSPANAELQMGQTMSPSDLETKLLKLNKNLVFKVNEFNKKMKALYHNENGILRYICSYHNEIMPEHSIVKVVTKIEWDYKQTAKPLDRVKSSQYKWVDGKGFVFDDSNEVRPGWKKVKKPSGELKRGWRTVILKLLLEKLVTPTSVEKEFGLPTSPFGQRAWAWHSGKRGMEEALPW